MLAIKRTVDVAFRSLNNVGTRDETVYGAGYPLGDWACMYPCRCYASDVTTTRVRLAHQRVWLGLRLIALRKAHGVDIVVRQHQRRITDFGAGKRLGVKDHVVRWSKPQRPAWMDQATKMFPTLDVAINASHLVPRIDECLVSPVRREAAVKFGPNRYDARVVRRCHLPHFLVG